VRISLKSTKGAKSMSRDSALVSADWAEKNLETPGVVFVEVDEDTTAYDGGHIPGAIKLDWKKDWYFKLYGHGDVKLLDGGRKKWELDARAYTTDLPQREKTSYTASAPDLSIRAFRDEVVQAIGAKNLVDVRSPDEFAGRLLAPAHLPQEQSQRGGHIPTAINVPWSKGANEDGTFKSDEELAKLYGDAGLDNGKDTIAYCRIGERSSHTWFILKELLGKDNVKNYDGSWTEYGSLIGVPIVLGDEPGKA
jgi:thiosulfate/3-mercaptopyruvate sulfurtransferase